MIRIYLKFTTVDVVMKFLHPEDNRKALLFNLRIVILSCIESSRDVGNGSLIAILMTWERTAPSPYWEASHANTIGLAGSK